MIKAKRFVPYSVLSSTLWAMDRAIPHASIIGLSERGVKFARAMRDTLEEYWETETPERVVMDDQDSRNWASSHSPLSRGASVSGLYLGLTGPDAAQLKRLVHLVRKSNLYSDSRHHNSMLAAEQWFDLLISV